MAQNRPGNSHGLSFRVSPGSKISSFSSLHWSAKWGGATFPLRACLAKLCLECPARFAHELIWFLTTFQFKRFNSPWAVSNFSGGNCFSSDRMSLSSRCGEIKLLPRTWNGDRTFWQVLVIRICRSCLLCNLAAKAAVARHELEFFAFASCPMTGIFAYALWPTAKCRGLRSGSR